MGSGHKIFISYKYGDGSVAPLPAQYHNSEGNNTARSYVNVLQDIFEKSYHINKGETDDASLEGFKDSTIQTKLGRKIFDSSITIVLISKGMRTFGQHESEQWIPWEIKYSLREKYRKQKDGSILYSRPNGMIAVALPDEMGNYDYAVSKKPCGVREWQTNAYFYILGKNMFNKKKPIKTVCSSCGNSHHNGNDHSYIIPVRWDNFITDYSYETYIKAAHELRDKLHEYNMTQKVHVL